ncbi:MAG: ferrous iron transport protein A [Actinomycetota bacterium]
MTPAELRALPIGTRVVVRYRLHDDEHSATDALGDLVAVGADRCTVATRRGEVVIAMADIVMAKTVPPPPAPRPRRAAPPAG